MNHDLPLFRLAYTVHSDITLTLVFFNNCNLANVSLIQFENKHLEVEAKHEMFRKKLFNDTPGRSVSLLTSVLNAQTAITGGDFRACRAILLSYGYTHYHNSNLIWRTVSRQVDEVISSDHPRRVASRVIIWYGLIHET